jgi:hypothetical protein
MGYKADTRGAEEVGMGIGANSVQSISYVATSIVS